MPGRSSYARGVPTVVLVAMAFAAGLLAKAGTLPVGAAGDMALYGVAVAIGAYLLIRLSPNLVAGLAGPLALGVMLLAAVLPEYAIDVYFVLGRIGGDELAPAPFALAGFTGANHLLIGLVWPLAAMMYMRRSGGRLFHLGREQRAALLLLLLAALYAFTIYLKSFLSPFDTLFLLLLFGAYVWTGARSRAAEVRSGAGGDVSRRGTRPIAAGAVAGTAIATAIACAHFADSVAATALRYRVQGFTFAQWLVPLVSKAPLVAMVAALSLRARTDRATSVLVTAQIGQLTVLVASVPLAFYVQGLIRGDAGSLALDGRQASELLLTSAQTLFMVVVSARMTVSSRGAMAMFGLFVLQAALVFAQRGGGHTTAQDMMSVLYIGAAVLAISRDRSRLHTLLAVLPVRRGQGDGENSQGERADT